MSKLPCIERIFGPKSAMRLWFARMILYSNALTLANAYVPFTDIGAAAMNMLAKTEGIEITEDDRAELATKFAAMPAHSDRPARCRPAADTDRPRPR